MVTDQGEWDWPCFEGLLPVEILLRIAAKKPPVRGALVDLIGWSRQMDRQFTVRSAYVLHDIADAMAKLANRSYLNCACLLTPPVKVERLLQEDVVNSNMC
ncbi:hypothetical protein V6N11_039450 [Hibiscus sabdariffa]|uniref:Uncharacterized protein n=1 Tax=Hibiscus sabdariffa TaxID=183260 RepID=A0ABR2SNH6_9ROSI